MSSAIEAALECWLERGGRRMGQIHIHSDWTRPAFSLRHIDDLGEDEADLEDYAQPECARQIGRFDGSGGFRPLNYAPTLRRGWLLHLSSLPDLRRALDFFYPACLGLWTHFRQGDLPATPLRESLARQTGIYRITQLISDTGAQETVASVCDPKSGCLRRILWEFEPGCPISPLPTEKRRPGPGAPDPVELPLLCREACAILVAACRVQVKTEMRSGS
ncbi:MAG TPA: DR2241 family protein [Verrucomicrobiales bacterium]|nr:DR2241 family protein [Verrucomicrobiales bacterium]